MSKEEPRPIEEACLEIAWQDARKGQLDAMDYILYFGDRYLSYEGYQFVLEKVAKEYKRHKIADRLHISREWYQVQYRKFSDNFQVPEDKKKRFEKALRDKIERILKENE